MTFSDSAQSNPAPAIAPDLAAAAAAVDAGAAAAIAPAAPELPAFPSQLEPLTDLCEFTIAALTPLYPSLPTVYTPDVLGKLAKALDKVFVKYKISCDALGPEMNLALILAGLAVPTYEAIKRDTATRKAQLQQAQAAAAATSSTAAPAPSMPGADLYAKA